MTRKDSDTIQEEILLATLPHVPFDGWTDLALTHGAEDAGYDGATARRLIPGGGTEMIARHSRYADRKMLEELAGRNLDAMKIRDRIKEMVKLRLQQNVAHREAVRRAVARLALPQNAALATKLLYRTVDAMWHAAGDSSTDYNFYTKRTLLAGVYTTTLMCWLNDNSEDQAETWAFLDRRIAEVMRVPKAVAGVGRLLALAPNPLRIIRAAANPVR